MVTRLKPYNPSATELVPAWHVVDARDKVLGRLATEISMRLMGKDRPGYVPHLLSGDFVIVINADKIRLTGHKRQQMVYKRHSQRPGHLKEIPYETVLERHPERIIEHSVKGMLPKNKLGTQMLKRLKIYAGEEHPHSAQLIGSERRLAAIAAGEAEATPKKAPARRRRAEAAEEQPAEETAEAVAAEATEEQTEEAPAKKTRSTRTSKSKSAASKSSDAKSSTSKSGGGSKSSSSRSRSSTSKSSSSGKSSSSTANRRSTTRPSRSSSSRKSGE